MVNVMNVTSSIGSFQNVFGLGGLLTLIIFTTILLTLFLISKNIRRFFVGAIITGILFGVYKLSRWISLSATIENNYEPIKWFGYIVIFIIVAIICGKMFSYTKWGKELDNDLDLDLDRDKGQHK